jgi:predicted secreted protein
MGDLTEEEWRVLKVLLPLSLRTVAEVVCFGVVSCHPF